MARTYRMHGRGNPDKSYGTHAYYVEVTGTDERGRPLSEELAMRIAARHPKARDLSTFWFLAEPMDGGWLVKVAYVVEAR